MPYGSITAQFQFHKGTIKPARCGSDGTRLYHFNSIKVRLNLKYVMDFIYNYRYFNSIKVRLNPSCSASRDVDIQFQFHKGTIKP